MPMTTLVGSVRNVIVSAMRQAKGIRRRRSASGSSTGASPRNPAGGGEAAGKWSAAPRFVGANRPPCQVGGMDEPPLISDTFVGAAGVQSLRIQATVNAVENPH